MEKCEPNKPFLYQIVLVSVFDSSRGSNLDMAERAARIQGSLRDRELPASLGLSDSLGNTVEGVSIECDR